MKFETLWPPVPSCPSLTCYIYHPQHILKVSLHFSPLGSLRSRGISVSPRRLLITTSGVHDTKAGHHVLNTCPNAYKWLIYLKSSVYMAPPNRVNQFWAKLLRSLKVKVKVTQSCPTLCNPMDYTVYGILQARILEWVALPFSRGSSQPRDWTQVSRIAGEFFISWAVREAQEYWRG